MARRGRGASLAGLVLLGCNSESDEASYSQLGDDVEREGWVDVAHPAAGDGATSFESFPRSGTRGEFFGPWQPSFIQEYGFDAGPLTTVVGEHLLSLSRYRGLVSTRLTGADAPHVEAGVPLAGLPVGLVVSDGMAAVMVVDAQTPGCVLGDCVDGQASRVVLVDVRDLLRRPRCTRSRRLFPLSLLPLSHRPPVRWSSSPSPRARTISVPSRPSGRC